MATWPAAGMSSRDLGIFFDLTADKLFVSTILIVMVRMDLIAAWMVIVIVSREFIVSGSALLRGGQGRGHRSQSVGQKQDICDPDRPGRRADARGRHADLVAAVHFHPTNHRLRR